MKVGIKLRESRKISGKFSKPAAMRAVRSMSPAVIKNIMVKLGFAMVDKRSKTAKAAYSDREVSLLLSLPNRAVNSKNVRTAKPLATRYVALCHGFAEKTPEYFASGSTNIEMPGIS